MKLFLNAEDNEITYNKKNYLLRAAKRMGLKNKILDIKDHPGAPHECVLNIDPYRNFIKGSKWTGVWEIDMFLDRQQMSLSDWIASDVVFVANSNLPDRMNAYQGKKVVLFQACDPAVHRRISSIKQDYDFVFSGSVGLRVYEERERVMGVMRRAGFSFKDQQKGHVPAEYVKKINEARVQFIRSGCNIPITNSQVEQRFFECLAIGPVLKDYHPDLEQLGLIEGVDYFSYKDDAEMIEKMGKLIDDPVFAEKMAENGRKKAITYHTYENRLASILVHIRKHLYG